MVLYLKITKVPNCGAVNERSSPSEFLSDRLLNLVSPGINILNTPFT